MKFSLVMGTVGRTVELERFLDALAAQSMPDFELIIVDQNEEAVLSPLLAKYPHLPRLRHLRVGFRGLSRARNAGLALARGEIVAFPDDDCWYPPDLLERIDAFFSSRPECHGVCGRSEDGQGRPNQIPWPAQPAVLSSRSVWKCAISYTVFLRADAVRSVGMFDESLGVGAGTPWGSGEETDFLLRALAHGYCLRYEPSYSVCHPSLSTVDDAALLHRARSYGRGMGYVLRKHGTPVWFCAWMLFRALGGAALALATLNFRRALFHWNVLRGRAGGLLGRQC